jgi:putative addiction module component (TIGR02574 family)
MSDRVKELSREGRKLPPPERAELIDDLISSLDEPDARIDALWAAEAEDRLAAIQRGEIPVQDAREVIAELKKT